MIAKIFSTQESKIHHVWHPIKNCQACKKQENVTHNKGKKQQQIETDLEITRKLELLDENSKSVILAIVPKSNKIEEIMNMLRKDLEDIKTSKLNVQR